MKLSEVQEEWEADSRINRTDLGNESLRTPMLHSKYLNKLSNVKLLVRKAEADYLTMRKDKYRYFKGELTRQELADRGWHQYQGRVPLKSEMEEYLTTDGDMIRLTDKLEFLKTVQFTLEQIMKAIGQRGWDIKSAIEWEKMQNGIV
jgi:hypothetical protein